MCVYTDHYDLIGYSNERHSQSSLINVSLPEVGYSPSSIIIVERDRKEVCLLQSDMSRKKFQSMNIRTDEKRVSFSSGGESIGNEISHLVGLGFLRMFSLLVYVCNSSFASKYGKWTGKREKSTEDFVIVRFHCFAPCRVVVQLDSTNAKGFGVYSWGEKTGTK